MNTLLRRAWARHLGTIGVALGAAWIATVAAEAAPAGAPLSLDEAARLAVTGQPLLEAQDQSVRAARAAAIAAAQLPDPMLVGGVVDVMLGGPEAYSLTGDGETQVMLGVKQMVPGGGERRLMGERGQAEAARMTAELNEQQRMVRREAALAWVEVWKAIRGQQLLASAIVEAERQRDVADIAYRAGRAGQADLLGSRVGVELLNDQLAGMAQEEWHARNQLRRWIGDSAERPLALTLPAWRAPDEAVLLQQLERHPHVTAQDAAVRTAQAEVALARADYVPDWAVELAYGYRPDLTDMATLKFEIGLPVFRRNRQDRVVESRNAEMERARSLREDWLRQHRAEVRLNLADWNRLQDRFRRYDDAILPQAQQRLEAALAAYATGSGMLMPVIDARRSLLEIRMQRLALEADAAQHQVQLQYFASLGEQP
jgi:cobalt-zinc-cadmium efflux system outer membrane protein